MPCAKVGPSASSRAAPRVREQCLRRDEPVEEAPIGATAAVMTRPVKTARRPALPDRARQQRAGAHVATGQPHAHEQERGPRRRGANPQVRGKRHHCPGARARAVDRGDDRLRTFAHREHEIAGHPGECQQLGRRHPGQWSDDLVHVDAGAEIAAGARHDDRLDVARVHEAAEQVAQFRIRRERQRILALGPIERQRRHLAIHARFPAKVLRLKIAE